MVSETGRGQITTMDLANGVVAWYQERFGRGPTRAKAYLNSDYVLVVLGEVQSKAERTLVEQGDADSRQHRDDPRLAVLSDRCPPRACSVRSTTAPTGGAITPCEPR